MNPDLLQSLAVTASLAAITTACLMLLTPPLAWWLARTRHPVRPLVEALVALPLVLPPTVLGFYLLLFMSRDGILGGLWHTATGESLAFTFSALVIGSVVYSLPFVAQPIAASFRTTEPGLLDAASVLGFSPRQRFLRIVLPVHRRALLAGAVLGFAHTIGEFGIVLMIGGNIPGETRVLSILLFDQVEALNYASAHLTAGILLLISLITLTFTYAYLRRES
ncbi:MAG: molybdate ABC transporter permease subunit [Pseudomonadales bacterium]|jgi:molybdate transport system permease protein|nr:molybdate ABC transporter permease subunit [Pseudomonadales bacterium]MDP6470727.1 molybdate ABC transporter permease subunit [Pseudomonadales bacterium]MDP6828321.1 molybdate ABC transporter permease subunit [Pseudomonadales bacterium]MDP6972129.1 molybdate ABC transporter permease subunit [Pseudomonadales bacterium]|tara:strand:+ start:52 stop:717 length:666 start_codon:yes stop_codon:yes gene_type:complete